ncbi:MAG TPA: preprotein translocase subunit SecG [Dokdonella sp.]|jgi:preprotein translocase subunit SecG|nr:preprotein translocase subunit SecG [Dokdonella sp.]
MFTIIAQVFYVLIAVAMIALILMQRGAGADAGSGFGGGASSTVFGARGSANFLSRSTAVLAGLFFLLSLGMGMYHSRPSVVAGTSDDLGVMAGVAPTAPAPANGDVPAASTAAPASSDVPAPVPAQATGDKPAPEPVKPEAAQPDKARKDGA